MSVPADIVEVDGRGNQVRICFVRVPKDDPALQSALASLGRLVAEDILASVATETGGVDVVGDLADRRTVDAGGRGVHCHRRARSARSAERAK